ncbi:DUF1054 domain-containing protein [Paenibacillus cremeus]|uniref:UPF0637 protein FPZ49_27660 n=1 Tax=Paenibacillus cremeus TaxID=2163881 RepID=A0A559K3M2_9BACL|nr:DUF1054 domain-containing protein [Paenibacillus cremeus]TVY06738.1 DUF1054 domain-containing protein [Paenibacillus cremeus]
MTTTATTFEGFRETDFDTFRIEGLEGRMEAIRSRIQPKFRALSDALLQGVSVQAGEEMFLHIAKHARRTVNAPVDTWMAMAGNKRGYKAHPHFQIGLFDDRVFIWLALIYELPSKKAIAETYLSQLKKIRKTIPSDFMLSFDHMKKDAFVVKQLGEAGLREGIERFRDIKSSELLIGRTFMADEPLLRDGQAFVDTAAKTFETLMPLYKLAQASS